MSFVKQLVEKNKAAFEAALENVTLINEFIKNCCKDIQILKEKLQKSNKVSEKTQITTALGQLLGFRMLIKGKRRIHGGGGGGGGGSGSGVKKTACIKWKNMESAFKSRIKTGLIININHTDPKTFLEDCCALFKYHIQKEIKTLGSIKVNTIFCCEFIIMKNDKEIREFKYFNTKNAPIYENTDQKLWFYENVQEIILRDVSESQERDSGWSLSKIINLQVNINKFTLMTGSSYIKLPKEIEIKHACINVQNNDECCFLWALMSALYPVEKNSSRVTSYPHYSGILNLTGKDNL